MDKVEHFDNLTDAATTVVARNLNTTPPLASLSEHASGNAVLEAVIEAGVLDASAVTTVYEQLYGADRTAPVVLLTLSDP